jgi:hypothetical protein
MAEFIPDTGRARMTAETILSLTPESFREKFGNTPLVRAGLSGITRSYTFISATDPTNKTDDHVS